MAISDEANGMYRRTHATRHQGFSFLIEALAVVVFLMVALAIFARLFAGAQIEGIEANHRSQAVLLATNIAEEFSANPTGVQTSATQGDLEATCDVSPQKRDAGTYFEAHIVVREKDKASGEPLFELDTSRYVSDRADGAADATRAGGTTGASDEADAADAQAVDARAVDEAGDAA